jgi:hypothetical protein
LQNRCAKIPKGSTRRDRFPELDLDAVNDWIEAAPKAMGWAPMAQTNATGTGFFIWLPA